MPETVELSKMARVTNPEFLGVWQTSNGNRTRSNYLALESQAPDIGLTISWSCHSEARCYRARSLLFPAISARRSMDVLFGSPVLRQKPRAGSDTSSPLADKHCRAWTKAPEHPE